MSLYARNPDVPAYRPRPYPKRRRDEDDFGASRWRMSRGPEPCYADFFAAMEEADGEKLA